MGWHLIIIFPPLWDYYSSLFMCDMKDQPVLSLQTTFLIWIFEVLVLGMTYLT